MATDINEFHREMFQDINLEAGAGGKFLEDVFFEKFCNHLVDAGELSVADRAFYKGPVRSGIRVDGFGGDPIGGDGTLSLIVADFNQADRIERLVGSEMNAILGRPSRFLRKALDVSWRNALEETSQGFGLADLIASRWTDVTRVRMFLISNRELSDRVDGRDADEIEGRTITYSVWDIRRFHEFVAGGQGREEIDIDLSGEFGGGLPMLPAHLPAEEYRSYLAVVPGRVLAAIYDRWGARLLEQNVRVFLQARNNVNKGIRNTLQNDPTMFFAYNNGITATAENLTTVQQNGALLLTSLKNFQIVNGGQTTASIHAAYRRNEDLTKVCVQMKLSVVAEDRTNEVVPKISEFANSQNRVNAADFFANHPFHVRIEEFSRRIYAPSPDGTFHRTKWFYERARGQYANARSLLTAKERRRFDLEHPRSQLFSKTDIAKYLNVWSCHPDRVSLGAQKNFVHFAQDIGRIWEKSSNSVNEAYFREAVAKTIIFRRTERLVSEQAWYQGGYRANVVAYAISKVAYDVSVRKYAVDFESIWQLQSPSKSMEDALVHAARLAHGVLIDPPSGIKNVTEWAKKQACWDRVKRLEVNWPSAFYEELISLEESKSVIRHAKKEQKVLNGIMAQMATVNAGDQFWKSVLEWGRSKDLVTPKDAEILRVAASGSSRRPPSERQSIRALEILEKLGEDGCPHRLPS